ncbi:MAG: hypothetical protein ABR978_04750 [Dehalococcoidia bacterium]
MLDNETAKAAVREAEAALAALSNRDEAPAVGAAEALTDIRELWPDMRGEERRDLARLVLSEVNVDLRGCFQRRPSLPCSEC